MPETLFTASLATAGPLDNKVRHVGWSEREAGDGAHLIIMRSGDESSEVPCFVAGNGVSYQTVYGYPEMITVAPTLAEIVLPAEIAKELHCPTEFCIAVPSRHPAGFGAELTAVVGAALVRAEDDVE